MKNTWIIATLLLVALTSSAFSASKNGKVIIVVSIEVNDYPTWKKSFDAGSPVRDKAGIKVLSVCSSIENQNQVMVIEEAENAQVAHDFLALLKSKQKEGEINKLIIKLYDKAE